MRVLILLALLGTALAVPKTVSRIVGGEETTVEQYPYMSNMQYYFNNILWRQFCGGSLLTTTIVLSAAHCYVGDSPVQWRVRLGTNFASTGGSEHLVSSITIHESYNDPRLDNDVAIVRLSNAAVYSNTVQAARIAGVNYILPDDDPVYAIGWGTLYTGGPLSEHLRHVEIYVVNHEFCAERYAWLKTHPGFELWPDISASMLCAGIVDVGGKDACQGDSGGPLAHDGDVIVGVTSWGYGCAHELFPGVNARVSFYSDWIVQNAQ